MAKKECGEYCLNFFFVPDIQLYRGCSTSTYWSARGHHCPLDIFLLFILVLQLCFCLMCGRCLAFVPGSGPLDFKEELWYSLLLFQRDLIKRISYFIVSYFIISHLILFHRIIPYLIDFQTLWPRRL